MKSFVVLGILVMGMAYYALSGGADFVPERRENRTIFDQPARTATQTATQAEAAGDAARAVALAAAPAPATAIPAATEVAAPVFTSLAQRREALAAIAAAEAASRAAATDAPEGTGQITLTPAAAAGADLRVVDGSRVNLRDGPGTSFVAIDQLSQGTIAEVLEYGPGNWVRVQVQGTTQSGWMSSNFLVTVN